MSIAREIVGFAMEAGWLPANAKRKLKREERAVQHAAQRAAAELERP